MLRVRGYFPSFVGDQFQLLVTPPLALRGPHTPCGIPKNRFAGIPTGSHANRDRFMGTRTGFCGKTPTGLREPYNLWNNSGYTERQGCPNAEDLLTRSTSYDQAKGTQGYKRGGGGGIKCFGGTYVCVIGRADTRHQPAVETGAHTEAAATKSKPGEVPVFTV